MLNFKEAVNTASLFIRDLYPQAKDIRLEEIYEANADSRWNVVVSFKLFEPNTLESVLSADQRLFKTVQIEKSTNQPLSLLAWKQ